MHISTCNQVTKKPVQANCETRHSSNVMHSLHYCLIQRFIFIYYVNVAYLIKKSRKHLSMEFGEACMYPEILMDENVFNSENGTTDHTSNIFKLYDGKLHVEGFPFLSEVESTLISLTPFSSTCNNIKYNNSGAFLGFHAPETASRHVIPLGKLQDIRFMSIFRFKVWWSTLCVGRNGSDVEYETQFLLFDTATASSNGRHLLGPVPYVLFLPIIDGKFRASLQGSCRDTLDLCMESGSPAVQGTSFKTCVYIHAGENPYDLARDAVLALRTYLGTFTPSVEKLPPPIIDKFGWCTWDGFYMTVNPEGARRGVQEFADGGCSLGFLIIDDGWQSISDPQDPNAETTPIATSDRMTCRLRSFSENSKFKNYNSSTNTKTGMAAFVEELKWDFKTLKYVYVWHALCGYWGGVHPSRTKLKTRIHMHVLSEGLKKLMPDPAVDNQFINGVAVIHPNDAHEFYDTYMHSHIAKMGIDGIKIDVLHEIEMICSEYGGRVEMNKAYLKALTASIEKHFKGNQVIASMEQCNDFMLLGTKTISCGRVGDDFWTVDPGGDANGMFWLQGLHIVNCAYNSLWIGQFMHPDWDMFQTTHASAEFHAGARAICGGPVYVSDCIGHHNFQILKRLVLPDGTILRCCHFALPTRDRLFCNPLNEPNFYILKIWNLNKYSGVVGAFNCQGAGWDREQRRNRATTFDNPKLSFASTSPMDVEWSQSSHTMISVNGTEEFAVYSSQVKKLSVIRFADKLAVSLKPLECEIFTMAPLFKISDQVQWAPIGLLNMLNSGGSVQKVCRFKEETHETSRVQVWWERIEVKGYGDFAVYSSIKPKVCRVNGVAVDFDYNEEENKTTVKINWGGGAHCTVDIKLS